MDCGRYAAWGVPPLQGLRRLSILPALGGLARWVIIGINDYPVLSMDYLKIFNPLDTGRFQFLTGGWRGFKNEAGKMIGSHQMSTKARDAYDAARKEGKPDEMRKIAEEQNQIRKDREAAKVANKATSNTGVGSTTDKPLSRKQVLQKLEEFNKDPAWNKLGKVDFETAGTEAYLRKEQKVAREIYDRVLKPHEGSAKQYFDEINKRRENIALEVRKVNDQVKALESKISKTTEANFQKNFKKAQKRRSADNPYGLSGDGRGDYKQSEAVREQRKELTRLQRRAARMLAESGVLYSIGERLKDNYKLPEAPL